MRPQRLDGGRSARLHRRQDLVRSNNWCRPGPRVLLYGGPRTYARLPTDKIMLSLTTLADELEREKARLRVTDAMDRKAKGWTRHRRACLRDDNVEIIGAKWRGATHGAGAADRPARVHPERREGLAIFGNRHAAQSASGRTVGGLPKTLASPEGFLKADAPGRRVGGPLRIAA